MLRSCQCSNALVDFFDFLFSKFAASANPSSRINHRKRFYPKTKQRDLGAD